MSWQLGLLLFYITCVAQALFQRFYSQKSRLPTSFPPAISYLIGVTPLGIIVGLSLHHHVHWSMWLGLLLLVEGVFIGLYNWLSFKAIKRLPLARFQTVYQSYEIIVILLSWILLGERLTGHEIVGAVVLMCAALIALQTPSKTQASTKKGQAQALTLAILSALAMGIGLVAEKAALSHMDRGAYFIFGYGTQTIVLIVLALKDINHKTIKLISPSELYRTLIMGILSATVGFFYIISITKSNNISLITALSALTLPLIAVFSYIVLRERENSKLLWSATALGFIGLVVSALH